MNARQRPTLVATNPANGIRPPNPFPAGIALPGGFTSV